jgi:hypothetical protein
MNKYELILADKIYYLHHNLQSESEKLENLIIENDNKRLLNLKSII